MEKKFSEEDGILLIRQMIEQAKGNMRKGEGKHFVLWGYVITITCLLHFASYTVYGEEALKWSWVIWNVPVAIGVITSAYFIWKDSRKAVVKTYVNMIVSRIWLGFACCAISIPFLLGQRYALLIYPAISLVYLYALFLSASAFRAKWMFISVAICLVCVVLYKFVPSIYYPLLMAAMLISGNLIPGHIINYKAKKNV